MNKSVHTRLQDLVTAIATAANEAGFIIRNNQITDRLGPNVVQALDARQPGAGGYLFHRLVSGSRVRGHAEWFAIFEFSPGWQDNCKSDRMSRQSATAPCREAVGVFVTTEQLGTAADALSDSGFARSAIGLLAAHESNEASSSVAPGAEHPAADPGGGESTPETRWIREESVGVVPRAWLGGTSIAVTTALGATVVASAGVLGGALLAAAAGAATVAAVGGAMAAVIHESDAEYLEEQLHEGHLLLFVRTDDPEQERAAKALLSEHGALDVKVLTVATQAR